MKKILILLLATAMILTLCACSGPAMSNPDGSDTVAGVAVKTGLNVLEAVLVTALTVAGTAWAAKMNKHTELKNINLATAHVIEIAKQTVGELKQTVVDGMKSESPDGKLTPEQIKILNRRLLEMTLNKLDEPTKNLIVAAGADLCSIITGAAEDWIGTTKMPIFPAYGEIVDLAGVVDASDGGAAGAGKAEAAPAEDEAVTDVSESVAAGIAAVTGEEKGGESE